MEGGKRRRRRRRRVSELCLFHVIAWDNRGDWESKPLPKSLESQHLWFAVVAAERRKLLPCNTTQLLFLQLHRHECEVFLLSEVTAGSFCFFFPPPPSQEAGTAANRGLELASGAHCRQRRNSNAKLQAGALSISSHTAAALNRLNWTSASLRRRMESRQHLSPLPLPLFLSRARSDVWRAHARTHTRSSARSAPSLHP